MSKHAPQAAGTSPPRPYTLTVAQLIAKLQEVNQEALVILRDIEFAGETRCVSVEADPQATLATTRLVMIWGAL